MQGWQHLDIFFNGGYRCKATLANGVQVSVMRLLAVRRWGRGLEQVLSLHPASATVCQAVLPHWNFLRESWLQACSGKYPLSERTALAASEHAVNAFS